MSSVVTDERWHRLDHDGSTLEVAVSRDGWRTAAALRRDGEEIARRSGTVGVLLPIESGHEDGAERPAQVLVLSAVPGAATRVMLLVPKPAEDSAEESTEESTQETESVGQVPSDLQRLARAHRYRFEPPPGSFAARLGRCQREHPGLYASRHVALAAGKVLLGVLGVALFLQLIVRRVVEWIAGLLPSIDIPWPDIDLPSIPWPDLLPDFEFPDITLPPWLLAIAATAKFWVPVLIAVGIAVTETRKRRRRSDDEPVESPAGTGKQTRGSEEDGPRDAHD